MTHSPSDKQKYLSKCFLLCCKVNTADALNFLKKKTSPRGNACHKTMTGSWQRQHFDADAQQMDDADVSYIL